jgi:hypothetical protein
VFACPPHTGTSTVSAWTSRTVTLRTFRKREMIVDLLAIDKPGPSREDGLRQRHERVRAWVQQQQQASG